MPGKASELETAKAAPLARSVFAIAGVKFALHLWFNGWYDYFRDEFDYLACANHPAWG